ncbi:MAG: guanylate kinase [Actinobacteria bacterium]|uniref:guanylate kinase n=1 Tax=freshwater metagenome TaxID=449393 RepID=A0A6J6MYC6_9ZZZZ|nr:guanylate kinase [Actinomycetota bacterium]MSW21978.1 guanylate kinase [Actinomycetota bacterium]MSX03501.1 guanylate kinase [Actinomycetota bacterium]MSX61069.1 guanylate kinase [Actinomycetota bacterium]MSX83551.1 guanylate kinase [Actinomycetota bacterium]
MGNRPPDLSPQERKAAGEKAVASRRERAEIKAALTSGEIGIFEVINDGRQSIQRMRVSELLDAAPGIGPRRAFTIMSKAGISDTRRIGGLGRHQLQRLRSEMILNKVPVNQGALIVMSGPGGVGKSTITAYLRNHPAVWVSTSVTTREPRENERDGHDYHFITEEKFDQLIANNEFLEWAQFAGARYGTLKGAVESARNLGKHVLLEIEIAGARQIRRAEPEALLVFISPPSWEDLVERLTSRGTDSIERRAARLALAEEEMACAGEFDEVLINHQVEEVALALLSLATSRANRLR